jgi:FAD/FMN-containing dehydrogenase
LCILRCGDERCHAHTDEAARARESLTNISAMATWQDAGLEDVYIAWTRRSAAAIEPWSVSGGYVNYMQADEPIDRVRAVFGDEAFGRLRELKRRYDPDNVRQSEHPAVLGSARSG